MWSQDCLVVKFAALIERQYIQSLKMMYDYCKISSVRTSTACCGEQSERQRELAVQGASDTNTAQDREAIQKEIMQLTSEIDRVFAHTTFNEHDIFKAKDVIIAEYDTRSYQEVVRPTINENNAGKEGLYVDGPITSYATTEEKLGTDQYGSESYKTITSQIDTTTNTLRNTDTTDVTISKDIQSHVIEHQPEYIMIQSGSMEGNALAVRLYNRSSSDFNLDKVNVLAMKK